MQPIILRGHIHENGELSLDIPAGMPAGDVTVAIEYEEPPAVGMRSMSRELLLGSQIRIS